MIKEKRPKCATQPESVRYAEPGLLTMQHIIRHDTFEGLLQQPLFLTEANLLITRQTHGKFHQIFIEEGDSHLHAGRHSHTIDFLKEDIWKYDHGVNQ